MTTNASSSPGGASGLGAAIAAAVEEAGGTPIVLDLSPSSNGFEAEQVDLCDTRAAEAVVERVASRHSGLDAVVTAAGTDACGRIDDVGGATWEPRRDRQPAGHRGGRPRRAAHLERSRGKVITVGSTPGLKAVSDATAYCASKFGVVGFTRALAAEAAGRVGVTL